MVMEYILTNPNASFCELDCRDCPLTPALRARRREFLKRIKNLAFEGGGNVVAATPIEGSDHIPVTTFILRIRCQNRAKGFCKQPKYVGVSVPRIYVASGTVS